VKPENYAPDQAVTALLLRYRNDIQLLTRELEQSKHNLSTLQETVDRMEKLYQQYEEFGERVVELEALAEDVRSLLCRQFSSAIND
jgi:CII-binding regulator of phage lambda lysogenization HflD